MFLDKRYDECWLIVKGIGQRHLEAYIDNIGRVFMDFIELLPAVDLD